MAYRVTLVRIRQAPQQDINRELQWLGNSLGLFSERDRDSSCFRVFITLVRRARQEPLSSDQIAAHLRLSRGTVVHHLSRLMDSGIVVREEGGYTLREQRLRRLIADVERDVQELFRELQEVAGDIDEKLG